MRKCFNGVTLAILFGLTLSSPAPGALTIIGGTLHVSASGGGFTSTPPDKSVPPGGAITTAQIPTGNAVISILPNSPGLGSIQLEVFFSLPSGVTSASGTVSISETTGESVTFNNSPSSPDAMTFDLKLTADASNTTLVENTQSTPPGNFGPLSLAAGTYTLTWTSQDVFPSIHNDGFFFTMTPVLTPEPSSIAWALAGTCAMIARRHSRRRV